MNTLFLRPVIKTKISMPSQRAEVVPRPRLAERLSEGLSRPLVVVSAPGGYGKTTLVASALRERAGEFRIAWLSLDQDDGHPVRFFYHVVATLQSVLPHVGRALVSLVGSLQLPAPNDLVALLLNEVADSHERVVLVLDDYHVIRNTEIHSAMTFLIERMPDQMHVVLITREEPDLPLARWRSHQRVSEIGIDDLRFSLDEAALFLSHAMGLTISADVVSALEERTEGWVAGLQMAALSVRHADGKKSITDLAQRIAAFSGEHHRVLDYFANEVLRHQTPEIQDFLRRTAVLDQLCASLCDAVTGRGDSRPVLSKLEQANMFLIRLDDHRHWYRYHQLFADFLRSESDAGEQNEQHLKASAWYEARGFGEEAIKHAFMAKDLATTVRLFRAFADEVLSRGELSKLRGWLDELPDDLVRSHSDLACYKAWTLYLRGRTAEAQPYAALASALESEADPPQRRGMLGTIQAYIALNWGDPREAVASAKQALQWLGDSASFFRVFALSLLGQAQNLTGDRVASVETLRNAVQLAQQVDNQFMSVDATGQLAMMMYGQGQLREAVILCRNALDHFVDAKGTPAPVAARLYITVSILDHEQNDLEAARKHLQTGIALSRQLGMVFTSLMGLRALAKLQHVTGDRESAWDNLAEARELAQRPESPRRRRLIAVVTAELQLREGNVEGAARTLEEIRPLVGGGSEDEALVYARILLAQHQPTRAANSLLALEQNARKDNFNGSLITIHVLQALCKSALGERAAAVRYLEAAVSLAAAEGYRRIFLDEGRVLADLLSQVLHVAPVFVQGLLDRLNQGEQLLPSTPLPEGLSRREREILKLINLGLTNQQIADKLTITVSTTKWYLTQMFGKLQVRSRTQAVARGRELGLL